MSLGGASLATHTQSIQRSDTVSGISSVLVVDDERAIADLLATILNRCGFKASVAYSGQEAVEAAKNLQPDCIISDVDLPDINGVEAMILVRAFLPKCKVILFSGNFGSAHLVENANARGHYFEFQEKPIYPTKLIALLRA
jgi:DNA-binding NtrC family response regulator